MSISSSRPVDVVSPASNMGLLTLTLVFGQLGFNHWADKVNCLYHKYAFLLQINQNSSYQPASCDTLNRVSNIYSEILNSYCHRLENILHIMERKVGLFELA